MYLTYINKGVLAIWETCIFIMVICFYSENSLGFLVLYTIYMGLSLIIFGYFCYKYRLLRVSKYIFDNILILLILFIYGFLSFLFLLGTLSSIISGEHIFLRDYLFWFIFLFFLSFIIGVGYSFLIKNRTHGISLYLYSLFAMLGFLLFGIFTFLTPEPWEKSFEIFIFYTPIFILCSGFIERLFINPEGGDLSL